MSTTDEVLISSFEITSNPDEAIPLCHRRKGVLRPSGKMQAPGPIGRMVDHRNESGLWYEENHLEEWIARGPAAIFANRRVMLVASQNYAHLPVKIDLLFLDEDLQFHIAELKVKPIAKNGGEVPYKVYGVQVKEYLEFLRSHGRVERLEAYYGRFSQEFYGQRRQMQTEIERQLGKDFRGGNAKVGSEIYEIYVAEGFDKYAIDYFSSQSGIDGRRTRLVQYKFFPECRYIEFWEISGPKEE